jgi:RNA polymerase sigma factor (TIGR02999 family)
VAETEITRLLRRWGEGSQEAADQLFSLVYAELRRMARAQRRGRSGETLRTTALVHEAYVKLSGASRMKVRDREHFYAVASRAMRQILVDQARRRVAAKRGAGAHHTGSEAARAADRHAVELLAVDEALDRLAGEDERLVRVVGLRFFVGLSTEETARVLELSERTVKRDWRRARAFLHEQLAEPASR